MRRRINPKAKNQNLKSVHPVRKVFLNRVNLWFLFLLIPLNLSAGVRVLISPPRFEFSLASGGSVTNVIEVLNGGETLLHLKAFAMDWTMTENGDQIFYKAGVLEQSCASWIEINPTEFEIPPRQREMVRFTVNVPGNKAGGYWAVVFFESQPERAKGNVGVQFAARVGSIIYVNIAKTENKKGEIVDFEIGDYKNKKVQAGVTFQNIGNVPVRPKGKLLIKDIAGNKIGEVELPEQVVLPQLQRKFKAEWQGLLPQGIYRLAATIDYGAEEVLEAETVLQVTK